MAVVVVDLASGEQCGVNNEQTFLTASLYKLFVLVEAFEQRAAGRFSFGEPLRLEPRHAFDDPPEFQFGESTDIDTGQAVHRMIQFSDNASAQALRERLGFTAVADVPSHLGMTHTQLDDVFVTTAGDMALFLQRLYRGEVVDPKSSAEMLSMLRVQEQNDLIPAGMPAGIEVAHKTGEVNDVLNDAAIVYAPAGDYVLVTLSQNDGDYDAAVAAIQRVSGLVFDAYSGKSPPSLGGPDGGTNFAANLIRAPRRAPLIFSESSGSLRQRFDRSGPGAIGLALLLLGPVMVVAARVSLARRGRQWSYAEIESRFSPAERDLDMRFGTRRELDDRIDDEPIMASSASTAEQGAGPGMGSGPAPGPSASSAASAGPLLPSRRLQRIGELFHAHTELLDGMRVQFQEELQPLNELLARQGATMQQLLYNLEERLRPLNEYADSEEANLEALERRMRESGSDFVARSFSEYVLQQRRRIGETRQQIEQQRVPFQQYGEDQRDAVEVALARFDEDVEGLELNLVEQRKVMIRMLESMRSDSFSAVKEFLQNREEVMAEMATSGMTDPGEIGRSVAALRQSIEALARESAHIQSVLQTTDEADRRLSRAAPGGPRPFPNQPRGRETVGVGNDDEEASA